ncbi:MAG: transcription factor S [Methanobrevibacter sp.]|uniref:transcription factor S n=1 Tax=Methanobrevibacter sp. TaxID=66852 RepID=UPI001B702AFF|nr:transcription factor S [Methanobrevibacter sp.]MBP3792091.1 transcription factor S [Methanobrevibacter sp.]
MEFCPKCGAMMLPSDGVLKCNTCGYSDKLEDNNEYEVSREIKAEETVKMLGEDVNVGPETNETCPECGHDKATYKLLQTRSADEAPTRIFTCTKCKHTWRAYD